MIAKNWALYGYNANDNYGDFIGERESKEEILALQKSVQEKFTRFSISHFDGSMPDFTKTITKQA